MNIKRKFIEEKKKREIIKIKKKYVYILDRFLILKLPPTQITN